MEELITHGPSSAKKVKVDTGAPEDNELNDDNSCGSGGFAPCTEEDSETALFDQDTEPYDTEEGESNENLFGRALSPTLKDSDSSIREEAGTPVVELTEEDKKVSPPKMMMIESVLKDANLISNIVNSIDVDVVYEKLKGRRGNPNRVDLVINEILEDVDKGKKEDEKKSSKEDEKKSSKEDVSCVEDLVTVIDKASANVSKLPMTAGEIQQLLYENKDRPDRVDYVVSQILVKYYKSSAVQKDEYLDDMMVVLSVLPTADPEQVYKLIERNCRQTDRVQKVIVQLRNQSGPSGSLKKETSLPVDPKHLEDPLYRDMRIVCKVLPEKDPNEVYEYLTAHHDKKNRLKVVIEELMKSGDCDSQSVAASVDQNSVHLSDVMHVGTNGGLLRHIQEEMDELMEIFPDCDPNYIYDKLEERSDDKDKLRNIAMELFEHKNYPRLKALEERKKQAMCNRIQHLQFDMESFLVRFPDPMDTFLNADKEMSSSYKEHALQQLRKDYRKLKKSFLTEVLEQHNYHYHLSKCKIEKKLESIPENSKKFRNQLLGDADCQMPEQADEFFYYEKLYSENEGEIKRYLHDKKQLYELRLQEARNSGQLMECQCCFDEECLFENMAACPEGHLFCKTCVRRSAEVVIGQGKTDFKCMDGTCSEHFSLSTLQHVLPVNIFSIVLRKMQEEEIQKADIPDLVSCPFCTFAIIIPDQNDKVFKCLNPECLKESCRFCKEPNHIPLRCNEVEKQGEVSMRTYIEARLTEAMIRRCHKCQKAFVKEFGCNKMTCTCGASSCYVCRAPDIDYDHFTGGNCNQGDMNELHKEEMLKAAVEARDMYLREHPEAADIDLKYDPIKHVEQFEGLGAGGGHDEGYDDSGDEDY